MKQTETNEKKEFVAPSVEQLNFEENTVIETSGEGDNYRRPYRPNDPASNPPVGPRWNWRVGR